MKNPNQNETVDLEITPNFKEDLSKLRRFRRRLLIFTFRGWSREIREIEKILNPQSIKISGDFKNPKIIAKGVLGSLKLGGLRECYEVETKIL